MGSGSRSGSRGGRHHSRSGGRSASSSAEAANEIIVNVMAGETRVAILEQDTFCEFHLERDTDQNVTGSVILGRVSRVLPGMQAAFVDIGLEKAAFLYAGDYLDETGHLEPESDGSRRSRSRNGPSRQPPRIDTLLREGQEIVVQVAKDPIGTKGARITSHVSIAGRHLVLTPWSKRVGVSRRIETDRERRRLREIVNRHRPENLGFIIRTVGAGTRETDIEADIQYLSEVWKEIQTKKAQVSAPCPLYTEPALPLRVMRDFAGSNTKRLVVDDRAAHEHMASFLERFVPDPKPTLERYEGELPIFDHFGIERQIDNNLERKVWLKSGGCLIVDQSEALTAIDVNTGRYVGKRDLEETVLKTNLEAVKEVVHQLRFRNIGGLIIIDLIDMETAENRETVYRALQTALRNDKAKTNILKISELGLVEMTRKRTRENLVQQLCEPCSHCEGRGYVLSTESVAFKLIREVRKDVRRFCGREVAIAVHPRVAEQLLGPAKAALAALGEQLGREVEVRARPGLHQEQFEVTALGDGPPVEIPLRWLEKKREETPAQQIEGSGQAADARGAAVSQESDSPSPLAADPEEKSSDADPPVGTASEPPVDPVSEHAEPAPASSLSDPSDGDSEPTGSEDDASEVTAVEEISEAAPTSEEALDSEGENPILPAFGEDEVREGS